MPTPRTKPTPEELLARRMLTAVRQGSLAKIDVALAKGAQINANGWNSPYRLAARYANPEVFQYLLDRGESLLESPSAQVTVIFDELIRRRNDDTPAKRVAQEECLALLKAKYPFDDLAPAMRVSILKEAAAQAQVHPTSAEGAVARLAVGWLVVVSKHFPDRLAEEIRLHPEVMKSGGLYCVLANSKADRSVLETVEGIFPIASLVDLGTGAGLYSTTASRKMHGARLAPQAFNRLDDAAVIKDSVAQWSLDVLGRIAPRLPVDEVAFALEDLCKRIIERRFPDLLAALKESPLMEEITQHHSKVIFNACADSEVKLAQWLRFAPDLPRPEMTDPQIMLLLGHGRLRAAAEVLKAMPDPNRVLPGGKLVGPMVISAWGQKKHLPLVKLLERHGVDPHQKDAQGQSALMELAKQRGEAYGAAWEARVQRKALEAAIPKVPRAKRSAAAPLPPARKRM